MKSEDYYRNIISKWQSEFPSTQSMAEVWQFYEECGYSDPRKTLGSILDEVQWQKKRVLDFGCDTGFMLDFICEYCRDIEGVGVDINPEAIAQAKLGFPKFEFHSFDGVQLPFADKSFDLLFASAVIKHIRYEDRSQIYKEISRVTDQVFFIEADSKKKEEVSHGDWTFFHSNFEDEFQQEFEPIKVIHEGGDLLGLYRCKN